MNRKASNLRPEFAVLLPFVTALLILIVMRPYFGLADDWSFLVALDSAKHDGLWSMAIHYIQDDYAWGMIRPYYPFVSYVFYSLGLLSPLLMYVLNWAVVCGIVALLALVFARVFFPETSPSRRTFFLAFCAAYFILPQSTFLLIIAAMQEKWVLLATAASFFWFLKQDERSPALRYYVGSVLVLAIGFAMKAQFAMMIPALVIFLGLRAISGRLSFLRAAFIILPSVLCLGFLKHVAAQGSYTSRFGGQNLLAKIVENLHSPQFLLIGAIGLLWAGFVLFSKRSPQGKDKILWLLPSIFIFSFLALFLQWTYAGYLMAGVAFITAMMCALWVTTLSARWQLPAIVALALIASAVTVLKFSQRAGAYGSLGEFLGSNEIQTIARNKAPVFISCPEASVALRTYAKKFFELDADFVSVDKVTPQTKPRYAFRDRLFCPLGIGYNETSVVWTSKKPDSFQLVTLD